MKRILGIFLCVALLSFFFIGISNAAGKIVGTWKSVEYYWVGEKTDRTVTVTFNADGSAVTGMGEGTYTVKGDTITYTSKAGIEIVFEMQPDGRLKTENPVTKIIYEKQ